MEIFFLILHEHKSSHNIERKIVLQEEKKMDNYDQFGMNKKKYICKQMNKKTLKRVREDE